MPTDVKVCLGSIGHYRKYECNVFVTTKLNLSGQVSRIAIKKIVGKIMIQSVE